MRHSSPGRSRSLRLFWFAVACGVSALAGKDPGWPERKVIPELTLKNGEVLHNVTLISAGSTTAIAKWEDGRGSIPLRLLPDNVREELLRAVAAEQPPKPAPTSTSLAPVAPAPQPPAARVSSPSRAVTYPNEGYQFGVSPPLNPNDFRPPLPENVKLNNGFVMRNSEVLRWTKDSVTIRYVGGTVLVPFTDISAEQRGEFETRKEGALKRQKYEDVQAAQRQAEALKAERARQWEPSDE